MKYLSNDGIAFDSEKECLEHEYRVKQKQIEAEEDKKAELEAICKKYNELEELVGKYGEKYGVKRELFFSPLYELMDMLSLVD